MKFVLLEEEGEITAYEVDYLPIEDMKPEEQMKLLQAWLPEQGAWVQ